MDVFTNFIKIRVGLCLTSGSAIEMHTDAFLDNIYTTEEQIRSSIILPLNDAIGLHNWAIHFGQLVPNSKTFLADVWADRSEDNATIFNIIRDCLPDYKLIPFYQGTVSQRLDRVFIQEF